MTKLKMWYIFLFWSLGIGIWNLFGICDLGFEICNQGGCQMHPPSFR